MILYYILFYSILLHYIILYHIVLHDGIISYDLLQVVTCTAAVSACHHGSQWLRACQLLASMASAAVECTAETFNSAIAACRDAQRWPQATWRRGDVTHEQQPIKEMMINFYGNTMYTLDLGT